MADSTELDMVVKTLEALEREQAGMGLFRWAGMTAMARNAIIVLATPPPVPEPPKDP